MKKGFQQGQLDGLCGVYAIVNSAKHVLDLSNKQVNVFWQFLAEELALYRPKAFFVGLYASELETMLKKTNEYFPNLQISAPFKSKSYTSMETYSSALSYKLQNNSVAIIGLGDGWHHWTVVQGITNKSFKLIDSSNDKSASYSYIRHDTLTLMDEYNKVSLHPRMTYVFEKTENK